jgi:carboxyl-terminal processing protease
LLRNLTGDGLLLKNGRFDISDMKPGEQRSVVFTLDVLDVLKDNLAKLEVSVVDHDLRVVSSEKVSLPVVSADMVITSKSDRVEIERDTDARAQPLASSPVIGTLRKGSRLARTGEYKGYSRVVLGEGRVVYVDADDVTETKEAELVTFEPALTRSPPLLEVSPSALATRAGTVRVAGAARDADQVRDAYVFVGSRKVFYTSNRKASDPKRLEFGFDAELQPGINVITVVARENEDTATAQTLVVRRDGPNGEALRAGARAQPDINLRRLRPTAAPPTGSSRKTSLDPGAERRTGARLRRLRGAGVRRAEPPVDGERGPLGGARRGGAPRRGGGRALRMRRRQ